MWISELFKTVDLFRWADKLDGVSTVLRSKLQARSLNSSDVTIVPSHMNVVLADRVQNKTRTLKKSSVSCSPNVLLVGCGRSGTTLLASMLNAHPDINIPRTEALYPIYGPYVKVPIGPEELSERQWRRLKRMFVSDVAVQDWEHPPSLSDIDVDVPRRNFAYAYRLLHEYEAERSGKRIWGAKILGGEKIADRLIRDLPDAKFVRCVRDGRAVANSLVENDFGPTNVLDGARHWCASMKAWDDARQKLPSQLFYTVKYENLVLNTEDCLRDLLEYLGIPWHNDCLNYYQTSFAKKRSKNSEHSNLVKKPDATRINRALNSLTRDQIGQIEAVAGPYLERHGYTRVTRVNEYSVSEMPPTGILLSKFKYLAQFILTKDRIRRASFLQRHRRKIWTTIWPL